MMNLLELNKQLVTAVRAGNVQQVTQILELTKSMQRLQEVNVNEALNWAAHDGHRGITEVLLVKFGADINSQDKQGNTPLHWASYNGHHQLKQFLISMGADERILNGNLLTPAKFADVHLSGSPQTIHPSALKDKEREIIELTARVALLETQLAYRNDTSGISLANAGIGSGIDSIQTGVMSGI